MSARARRIAPLVAPSEVETLTSEQWIARAVAAAEEQLGHVDVRDEEALAIVAGAFTVDRVTTN